RPEGQEGGLGKDVTIRKAIDAAEPKIADAFRDQPAVEASIREALGTTYYYLGEPALAIRHQERCRHLRRDTLGPDHPATLNAMGGLALFYQFAGRLNDALPLFEETLQVKKAKLGFDHRDTLTTMENLAMAYREATRLDDALTLSEETLRLKKAKL